MNADVIVVGSGQAGVPLATRLAAAGKRVLIAERSRPGGTCVNVGCTPTKTMIASARAAHVARTARRLGVHVDGVSVDFAAVVARKDQMVQRWRDGVVGRLTSMGDKLTLLRGHARFVGDRELEIAGQRHRAETVVLNVGARPALPPVAGIESVPWLDNHRAMDLRELPRHLVVLGGGYIGCELGQMFRRFGAEVTIVDRGAHLLDRADPEVSDAIERAFAEEGIALRLGANIREVARGADGGVLVRVADGPEISGTHLLVATGRTPNSDDLGCDAAGIELDGRGYIVVDDGYETTAKGVYAVGDATPQPQFTHTSWDDHRILFDRLMGRGARGRGGRLIPSAVFTDPQVASVGLSEKEAKARGVAYEAASMPYAQIARAAEVDEPAGVAKVLVDPKTERLLGVSIVGAEAGELVHVFVVLMQAGASARAIVDAEFVHPTFAEGMQSLVMRLPRFALG
jgi:pyruvate/2-oxoglutarate dehydrogenase complex dihydrolipoamide dehydrogenase (E3) component